ncbi:hypothetical protein RCO48_30495 [Peribacillus frigoritolerans]|nr:hypothetical protein [Peribacillus frigoritolerans]
MDYSTGCRTLVRQADPEVLSLFGYTDILNNPNIITNAFIRNEPDSIFYWGKRVNFISVFKFKKRTL